VSKWTRRDLLKAGVVASAGVVTVSRAAQPGSAAAESGFNPELAPPSTQGPQGDEADSSPRERLLLDFGWRFNLGDADDPARDFGYGALARERTFAKSGRIATAGLSFDDGGWRSIDLPHDWAVELPFKEVSLLAELGGKPLGREYPETSIGWYRRAFGLPASDAGKRIAVEFDGVFRHAQVMFNGHYLGENFSGYAPFRFDVTDFANPGERNVLAVRVDATLGEGWFYEGAGIYRHVWLTKTDPLHLARWGTCVTSQVRDGSAAISISTEVENQSGREASCRVRSRIVDAEGNMVATAQSDPVRMASRGNTTFESQATVDHPALWSIEEPHLYRLITALETDGRIADRDETTFGIRTIRFDADKGFFLNGQPVKIKGTCNHQDHAGVGAALPDRLQYYRIERLKEMGSNAYRTSHNPPTPELLEACDRLGMVVMDETPDVFVPRGLEPARTSCAARPEPSKRGDLVHWQ
jgi:beta-galactosidase